MKDNQNDSIYKNTGLSFMFFATMIWGLFPLFYGTISKGVLDNISATTIAWLILFRTAGAIPCFICMILILIFFIPTKREERREIWHRFKRQWILFVVAGLCISTCRWFDYRIIRCGGSEYVTFACVFSVALVHIGSFFVRFLKRLFFKRYEKITASELYLSLLIIAGAITTVWAMEGHLPFDIKVFFPFFLSLTSATVLSIYFEIVSHASESKELTLRGKVLMLSLQQGFIHLLSFLPWGFFLLCTYTKQPKFVISAFVSVRPALWVILICVGTFGTFLAYFTEAVGASLYHHGHKSNTGIGATGWLSVFAFADPVVSLSISWVVSVYHIRRFSALEIANPDMVIIPILLMIITIFSAYRKEKI